MTTNLRVIVGNNPWEHWVLHEIIVGSSSKCIQVHQILKITDFTFLKKKKKKKAKQKTYQSFIITKSFEGVYSAFYRIASDIYLLSG